MLEFRFPTVLLVHPVGTTCNISCTYCFHRFTDMKDFSRKMKPQTFIDFYKNWIKTIPSDHPCEVIWHGGEPTLIGRDFYKEVLLETKKLTPKSKKVSHCIQTNGITIDEKWAALFKKYDVMVGVSMDGPKELHDAQRVRDKGQGTYDHAIRGYNILAKSGVTAGIVIVVNSTNVAHPDKIFEFMLENSIKRLQLSPCMELVEDKDPYSITPKQYSKFIMTMFDLWMASGDPEISIGVIGDFIDHMVGNEHYNCMLSDKCHNFAVLDHTGQIKTCDGMGVRQQNYGDIDLDISDVNFKKSWTIHHDKISQARTDNCHSCQWFDICHGGCPYHWPETGPEKTEFCMAHKEMFSYMSNKLAKIYSDTK